jgi:hypothetical protein
MLLTRTIICFFSSLLLTTQVAVATEPGDVIDHQPFEKILKEHVNKKGMVSYKALKASDDAKGLASYLETVAKADLKGHKRKAKLAFYINAYNAIVMQAVLDNLPTKSVMKVDGFFKKSKHLVAGKSVTLDALENQIIRKKFKEARIHFVLVCGAKSCPRLRRRAMTAKNLNRQLQKAAKEFVPQATQVKDGKVTTSQLFNWFKDDFVAASGSVGAYLAEYLPEHAEILKSTKSIEFSHYDWALNAR